MEIPKWISFKQQKKNWPVILYLHGVGERGTGGADLKKVLLGLDTLTNSNEKPYNEFVIIAPQCPFNFSWYSPEVMTDLEKLLDKIVEKKFTDEKRIYLTGFSMGGIGVMELAMKHPDRFAAIAPVCGRCENIGNIIKIAEANLPIWVIYAENDEKKMLTEGSKEIIERLKNTKSFHQPKRMNHNLKKSKENPNRPVNHIEARRAAFADPELYQWFLGISVPSSLLIQS